MSEGGDDLLAKLHREAAERYWEQQQQGRTLVERAHQAAREQYRAAQKYLDELTDSLHQQAASQACDAPFTAPEELTVHFMQLPEAKPDSPLYHEWNTYRREVARLLAEGSEGRHVLIKNEQIVGLWDSHDAAMTAGYQRFPGRPFLVHQVQERERVLRSVSMYRWPNLRFLSRQAS
jgi:hypothetical protein